MATNEPLVPSMIFRSRTTKASSKVTEQKACRRSFSLLSSMSLIRTSVMTTVVLLFSVAHSNATPNDMDSQLAVFLPKGGQTACDAPGSLRRPAQSETRAAAAGHQSPGRPQSGQPFPQAPHFGAEPFGR